MGEGTGSNPVDMQAAAPRRFQIRSIDLHCIPSVSSLYCSARASKGFLKVTAGQMEKVFETDRNKLHAKLRLHNVYGHMTEILELHAEKPSLQVLFIPGNPGIVAFYKDYVETVYELLERKASVTAIGHIAHTLEDLENGRLFSLQEQISHKIEYIKEEVLPLHIPILLYSMVRNFTFMGMTEFKKLQENLDWAFIKDHENQMAFIFGVDDHWGPLSLFEEVSKNAPGVNLTIEKEGHTHAFCCTKTGSAWVANHTVDVIKKHDLTS